MDEHEHIDAGRLRNRDIYRLMTDLVAPRPIAWVSSIDEHGKRNLAPFSYFQAVSSTPPTVMLGISWKRDGTPKDTLRNILGQREFTISHVSAPLAEAMNATSGEYDRDVDEWNVAAKTHAARGRAPEALAPVPSVRVAPPRVAGACAAFECKLTHAIPLGRGPTGKPSTTLVLGEVLCFSVRRDLLRKDEAGHLLPIDPAQLAAVGRLGGIAYTATTDCFELARPKVDR